MGNFCVAKYLLEKMAVTIINMEFKASISNVFPRIQC